MLRYYQDKFNKGREKADGSVLVQLLEKALNQQGISTERESCRKALLIFFAELTYALFNNPQQYYELDKFVLYRRGTDIGNLLTIESLEGLPASRVYEYYKQGGLYIPEVYELARTFVSDLLIHSTEAEAKVSKDISRVTQVNEKRKENEEWL